MPSEPDETSRQTRRSFRAIDHVGIAVHDLDQAITFYIETFGMQLVHQETNEDAGVREAMLAFGDSAPFIQLLAPLRDDSPIGRFLSTRGEGLQQIAFAVDDIEAATWSLREQGVDVLNDGPSRGTAGSTVNFIHPKQAGGVLVEIVQPAE